MTASLRACLNGRVSTGAITQSQADEAYELVRFFERQGMPQPSAAAKAAQQIADDAATAKRQKALQVIKAQETEANARTHSKGIAAGVNALFARDLWQEAPYQNVEARQRGVLRGLHALFADGIAAFRTKAAGLRQDRLGTQSFVRGLYGEETGDDVARAAMRGWNEAVDSAVEQFNRAGGDLRRRENWRLPQNWESVKVREFGEDGFRSEMLAALDDGRLRITDYDTGLPVSRERGIQIIDEAYPRLATDGISDLVPGQGGQGKVANSRTASRVFEWTTADAWFEFNEKFGVGNDRIYDLLTGHLDGMARDVALMEVLGPNPHAQARRLVDLVKKEGATRFLSAQAQAWRVEGTWDFVSGRVQTPVNEWLASGGRSVRSWLVSSQLGSAFLASLNDLGITQLTAKWNGIPSSGVMARYTEFMGSGEATRSRIIRAGLGAEGATQRAAGAMRHQAEIVGSELPTRIADTVMRASLLTPHTESLRWAFGWELLSNVTDAAERGGWDSVPQGLRRAMERYGIDGADWERLRGAGLMDLGEDVRMLDHLTLARQGRAEAQTAAKLQQMISTEQDFAVPTAGALERSMLGFRTRPGTFAGEFLRSTVQYKTFPVTIMLMHGMRSLKSIQSGDYGLYLAALLVSTTSIAALSLQAREVANGRDPRDMTDPKFWAAAVAQGGGLGILGDYLYSSTARSGHGLQTTLAGPGMGLFVDASQLTLGNITAALDEERDANAGRDLARFIKRYTPGNNIWWSRLATDRLIFDELNRQINPRADEDFARLQRRYLREFDQDFFWTPGESAPERAPELQ